MDNQQQSELLTNIGAEALAGSGFELEEPTRFDEVTLGSLTDVCQEDAQ